MKLYRRFHVMFIVFMCVTRSAQAHVTKYNKIDPLPWHSSISHNTYLSGKKKTSQNCSTPGKIRLTGSGYFQRANKGRDNLGTRDINLGNLNGTWNLIALFYPEKDTNSDIQANLVETLKLMEDYSGTGADTAQTCVDFIFNPKNYDALSSETKGFGQLSVPIDYRKYGARFMIDMDIFLGLGIQIKGGVSEVRQEVKLNDITCAALGELCPVRTCNGSDTTTQHCVVQYKGPCKEHVMNKIMKKTDILAESLNQNISSYKETSFEDLEIGAYWKGFFNINENNKEYLACTFVPFIHGTLSLPVSEKSISRKLFSISCGNNGHWGYGFIAGAGIDFHDTVQIVASGGLTEFSREDYINHPVPTHERQAGIFPRSADLSIKPGNNVTFNIGMDARNFLDKLSASCYYRFISHNENNITIIKVEDNVPQSNILINKMQTNSRWEAHFIESSITYEASKNLLIGAYWQAPLKQRATYHATTLMFSLIGNF